MAQKGILRKMQAHLAEPVTYHLPVDDALINLNPYLGQSLRLRFSGAIHCIACGRKTSKSFNQGYCYPCFTRLAECDTCIVKPERCHYAQGTCREPDWAQRHCFQPHIVYLANSSGVKVGITRLSQVPTRWIDQGATEALPMLQVASRWIAGLAEVGFAQHITDKTDWRQMLKRRADSCDLFAVRAQLLDLCAGEIAALRQRFGDDALRGLSETTVTTIDYPILHYPQKITALNFDKQADIHGTLLGIKGQYLIFDCGVLNIRKFAGYQVEVFD